MTRRPSLVILLVALVGAGTAACGSGSAGGTAAGPASAMATSAAVTAPAATASTKTVTVTVSSTTATRTTSATSATTTSTPSPAASAVSFTPFVGEWVGHTRDVTVSSSGRLVEHVGDGCCDPIIDLVLQLSNPRHVSGTWVATSRVVSAKVHPGWTSTGRPAPEPGDRGTVTVGADHILLDSITDNGFCDPEKTAPGTCGA